VAPLDFKSSTASDEGAGWVRFPHPPATNLAFDIFFISIYHRPQWEKSTMPEELSFG